MSVSKASEATGPDGRRNREQSRVEIEAVAGRALDASSDFVLALAPGRYNVSAAPSSCLRSKSATFVISVLNEFDSC